MLSNRQLDVLKHLKAKNQIKTILYSEKNNLKIYISKTDFVSMNVSKNDSLLIINQYTKK